jgi:hypothetical protein
MPERRPTRGRKLVDLTVDEMARIALAFSQSGRFTIKERGGVTRSLTTQEIFVLILAGQELGIGPSQSVMGIKMIEGKPEISAGLMAAMVKNSGIYDFRTEFGTDDDKWCKVTFFRTEDGEFIGESLFTEQMAKDAGLGRPNRDGSPGTWQKYWRNMYFARAVSNGTKWHVPDALMVSAYHEGEIGGDEEAPVPELPQQPQAPQIQSAKQALDPILGEREEAVAPEDVTVEPDREPAVVAAGPQDGYDRPGDEQNALDFDPVTEPDPPVVRPPGYAEAQMDLSQPSDHPDAVVVTPPSVEQSGNVRTISAAQIGLAHVRARAAQLSKQRYNDIVEEVTGVRHTDKIPAQPRELFDNLLKRLDAEALLVDRPDAVQPDPEDA